MPRKARIDAPGALHHIICRGIERRRIYRDDSDRQDFLNRLGPIIRETRTTCYAWALLPNNFHLNPLRAKMVPSMDELDHYEFCGHGVILGKHQKEWQDVDKLLGMSGVQTARWLGIGQPAVQRSVIRGEKIARELSLMLLP